MSTPGSPGPGNCRPAGTTLQGRAAVHGGETYITQAFATKTAFLTLLGKTMPLQLASEGSNNRLISEVRHIIVDPVEAQPMLTLGNGETKQ